MNKQRCGWADKSPLEMHYHDTEWGVPVHDDALLFEALFLESMQAGLSWSTILAKRESLRSAFDQFNYQVIAQYQPAKLEALLLDPGIIRHKLKIKAAVTNAAAFIKTQQEHGSFDHFIWSYLDYQPLVNHYHTLSEVPAKTPLSETISKDLKKRGFQFLGATSVYAFMQSIGMVDDHLNSCFCKTSSPKEC